jgi:DNA polymerase III gamma/tau subunit
LSLYLKYRPNSLDEIIGNEEIVQLLKEQLSKNSKQPIPHSLLFHGPTGCGKTTLGRIVAHELGAKGNDIREIDSADFRGIDTIRDIRKQSTYKPLEGPCRVWILDEVHQLTKDAQSALLKTLEDTPNHIYYILCTTEPQKLLPTIRGRCSQYQVQPLTEKNMKKLLRRVVKAEKESLSKEIYDQIIQDSFGHPRNALQILAQVLSVREEDRMKVAKKTAETQSKTIELCRALVSGTDPWRKIATILGGLKEEDPEQIRRAILGYCQACLLSKNPVLFAAQIMDEFIEPFYNSGFPGLVLACYKTLAEDEVIPF